LQMQRVGALKFGENSFIYAASARTVKGPAPRLLSHQLHKSGSEPPTSVKIVNGQALL
jgi:hypothetical protein